MTTKIFACAALLLASCGGTQTAGEQARAPETKTEVKHGAQIALLKPDPIGHDDQRGVAEPPLLA